jgi:hypothetical protein
MAKMLLDQLNQLLWRSIIFLRLFEHNLLCLTHYVNMSNDHRLIAIAGVDIPLGLVTLERALRNKHPGSEPTEGAKLTLTRMLQRFESLRRTMGEYVSSAAVGSVAKRSRGSTESGGISASVCDKGSPVEDHPASPLQRASEGSSPNKWGGRELAELWRQERSAPYVALAAAGLGGAYKDWRMASGLLIDWLEANPLPPSGSSADLALAWFRVRTLIQLANLLPSASGGSEDRTARLFLEVALDEFERLPSLPPIERYSRGLVKGEPGSCPGIRGSGPEQATLNASLFYTRIFLLARLLHAVVDNPDPGNRLNAQHLKLALALRDVDSACLARDVSKDHRRAVEAAHLIVYARVAFAWAADEIVSREQAKELKRSSHEALREGLDLFEVLNTEWGRKPRPGSSLLQSRFNDPYPFFPDLERARSLARTLRN